MRTSLTDRLSLRQLLTLPYAVLVVALALLLAGLSWRAGRDAVDTLSAQLLSEAVQRVAATLERQVGGADSVLEAAFPTGRAAPGDLQAELATLRERFWLATSIHRDPNNYVYYGDRRGHFIGLWRFSEQEAELRLRTTDSGPRSIHRISGIDGPLRSPTVEDRIFDPRERPWFQSAMTNPAPLAWTPVYVDFKTRDLILTRTKRLGNDVGEPEGVGATDLPLKQLSALLGRLALSENAVAMVVQADGQLVGVSRGAHLKTASAGEPQRLDARESPDALVASAFRAVSQRHTVQTTGTTPQTFCVDGPDGRGIQVGYVRLTPALGLDWLVIAAVPRNDFLASAQRSFVHAGWIAAFATLAVLALGWAVQGIVTRELRKLADAARRVGNGVLDEPPEVRRQDELGELARSFADMQRRLLTDQLTGLSNRSAILRRIEDRILQQRRRSDQTPFAIMFVDFDRFKDINDRFGHTTGDAALKEFGERLRASVRAGDIVARYASDEFVLLLESVGSRSDAEAARRHLEQTMAQPLHCLAELAPDHVAHASFGIALFPADGQDTESLLKHADADMYARKQARPSDAGAA